MSLAAPAAFGFCDAPTVSISIPHGATATREEMVEAAKRIQDYDTAVKEFVACLKRSEEPLGREDDALRKLRKIADQFNVELREFRAKTAAK